MNERYLLETGAPDGYLLEDGTGVLIIEAIEIEAALNLLVIPAISGRGAA